MKNLRSGWVLGVLSVLAWCGETLHASEGPASLAEVRAKAEGGDEQAMVEIARRYDWGNDGETEQDLAQARTWYEKAAAKGNGYAASQLAGMFKEGRGVEANPTEAFKWMQRAADAGMTMAQVELGGMHERAEGTRKNLVEALKWYLKAAEQSDPEGQYLAGLAYVEGRGTKPDMIAGVRWLRRASLDGHEAAGTKIWELRDADPDLPAKLLAAAGPGLKQLIARAEAGEAKAQIELAGKLQEGDEEILGDPEAAMSWWTKAGEKGEAEAMTELGRRYLSGEGVERDLVKADEWLKKAAEQKFAAAYFWLGAARDDYGDQSDPVEAAKYYRLGAEAGDVSSQRRLADSLEGGRGVEKDSKEALKWYVKAAEQGDGLAMMQAAMLASSKEAGVLDFALARKWAHEARKHNHQDADFVLESIDREEESARLAKEVPAHVPEPLREMFVEALRGDGWAQWQIAMRYSKGQDGMPEDEAAFTLWRERAAAGGRLEAQESLGLALTKPAFAKRNVAEGVKHLELAAAAGLSAARVRLAELLASGDGVEKDEQRAVELFEQEARPNNPEVMWKLREMYAKGVAGAAPDEKKAAEWLARASAAGHPAAKTEEAKIAAAKAAEAKAAEGAKFAEAERQLEADFAASMSLADREKAVREFSRTIAQLDWGNGQNKVRVSERVFRALIPKMQERVNEAGAYAMAINSLAFESAVMNRVVPENLKNAIKAHAQQVSAAFNAKQQALGPIQSLIDPASKGDIAKQMQIGDYLMQNHAAHDPEGALRWYKRAADAGHAPARDRILKIAGPWYLQALALQQQKKFPEALALFKKVAEAGERDAEYELGEMYYYGEGMAKPDYAEALKWYRSAAEKGMPAAMFAVGWMYRDGDGLAVDEAVAVQWFERAAAAGHEDSKAWLAVMKVAGGAAEKADAAYRRGMEIAAGNGGEAKIDAAAGWFRYAKRLGHAKAAEWVDQFAAPAPTEAAPKEFSEGMAAYRANNFTEALARWTAAAEKGSAAATFNVGVLHENGQGVPRSNAAALVWFEKAAALKAKGGAAAVRRAQGGIAFDEGLNAYEAQNYSEAMTAWQKAAELGNANAMTNVGVLYANGHGVDRDLNQAIAWYEKATAAGSKNTAELITKAKERLVGVEEMAKGDAAFDDDEYEQAVAWYEKAAELGSVDALMKLGGLYEHGDGVDKNPRKAIEWYKKAAAKGDAMAGMMAQALESSLPMYELMASQQEMRKVRDQIDGVSPSAPSAGPSGPKSGLTVKQLRKRSPWSAGEIQSALKEGADPATLAKVLKRDKVDQGLNDLELRRLLNTPEGQRIVDGDPLSMALHELAYQGAGAWTQEMAKAAIEARRAQVGRVAKVVDSPELRVKAAAGDGVALFQLVMEIPEAELKHGPRPQASREELAQKVENAKYARGYWLVADTLRNNMDKTKNDPVLRAELLFQGAESGDPRAMRELAMELIAPGETAVAINYADAEYWMIEAAARAAEGTMEDPYLDPARDAAFFYRFAKSNGGPGAWPLSHPDEPTLRWAREMIRRGGKLADVANVHLDAFELDSRTKGARGKMAALAPEVPLWSEAERKELEDAAKAGDAEAALKLGNGYATGRGVRQRDGKAVAYYEMAAAKGNVPAMRALAEHYFKGYGVKKDGAKRLAWLEKAGEAGDASAWTAAGDLQHYVSNDPGIPQNFERAIVAYQKAVAMGHGPAMHALGVMHEMGRGGPADKVKATEWYRKAAGAGERFSMTMLGALLKGEKKFVEAAEWYGKAADAGEEHGRFWQAQMLAQAGERARAIPLFQEVVAKAPKNSSAWLELGAAWHDSNRPVEAKEAYRKVIALVGENDRQGELAKSLMSELEAKEVSQAAVTAAVAPAPTTGKNADELWDAATQAAYKDNGREVVRLIQAAAAVGETASPWNRYRIALALAQGTYGVPKNEPRARELLKSAAEAGFASARLDYALAVMQGALGFAADESKGRALLAELVADADKANADAKYQIGMLVFHGRGVTADRARGIGLVKTAAEWNVPPAQFEIGRVLLVGMPELPADPAKGVEFLRKAMQNGVPAAAAVLGEVYEKGVPGPAGGPPIVAANLPEALKLYEAALKAGVQQVKPAVERLQLQLSGKGPRPEKK